MKRTPLTRKVPLPRSSSLTTRAGQLPRTRTALPKVSARRKREQPQRKAREQQLGKVGAVGICAMCGRHGEVHGHELRGPGFGKDWANPAALLCNFHNGFMEDNPRWAAWNGWKISTKWPRDPDLGDGLARRLDLSFHVLGSAL